jgi:hypothetical protein
LSSNNAERFNLGIREISEILGLTSGSHESDSYLVRLGNWLRNPANGKWLVVLDEMEGLSANAYGSDALKFVPVVSHGSVIVTSRDTASFFEPLYELDVIPIPPMSAEEAMEYLKPRLASYSYDDLTRLVAVLEGRPLTLDQAARDIRMKRMALPQYLKHLQRTQNANESDSESDSPGRTLKVLSQTTEVAESERVKTNSAKTQHKGPSRATKDSGYGSYESGNIVQEDAEEQTKASDVRSIKTLSSFVDLGLDGRLRGIGIFASDLVQGLDPDVPEVVDCRELVVAAVRDALRAYSYSLEQQNRPDRLSDQRKATHFIRQQSQ